MMDQSNLPPRDVLEAERDAAIEAREAIRLEIVALQATQQQYISRASQIDVILVGLDAIEAYQSEEVGG